MLLASFLRSNVHRQGILGSPVRSEVKAPCC